MWFMPPQARSKLSQIQASQEEVKRSIEEYGSILNGTGSVNLADAFPPGEALVRNLGTELNSQ